MAVAAGDRHARLREPELGADHVDDALVGVADVVERDAVLDAVALERAHHLLGHHVEKRPLPLARRHDVVDRRERALRKGDLPAPCVEHVERLRAGDLVHQVQADEQLRLAGRQPADGVGVPHLLKERLTHNGSLSLWPVYSRCLPVLCGSGYGAPKPRIRFASQSWMVVKYSGTNRCKDAISALLPTFASSWR